MAAISLNAGKVISVCDTVNDPRGERERESIRAKSQCKREGDGNKRKMMVILHH